VLTVRTNGSFSKFEAEEIFENVPKGGLLESLIDLIKQIVDKFPDILLLGNIDR